MLQIQTKTNFHILMSENLVAGFVHIRFFFSFFYLKSCSGLIWMSEVAPNVEQQQLLPAEVELWPFSCPNLLFVSLFVSMFVCLNWISANAVLSRTPPRNWTPRRPQAVLDLLYCGTYVWNDFDISLSLFLFVFVSFLSSNLKLITLRLNLDTKHITAAAD